MRQPKNVTYRGLRYMRSCQRARRLLVPRVAGARKRLSNGRIIIRTESPD